jgi:hypothetical protein
MAGRASGGKAMTTPHEIEQPRAITIDFDVPATVRDGTVLRANVYRPTGDGRWPVLLRRTPYSKDTVDAFDVTAARHGYVVITQDTRGRYQSEGEWYPYRAEAEDGFDTIAWAAALPYADGQVGLIGGSYNGFTQWSAATQQPAALKAIFPEVTPADPLSGFIYSGGAFRLAIAQYYLSLGLNVLVRQYRDDPAALEKKVRALCREIDDLGPAGYRSLPLADFAPVRRHDVGSVFFDELAAPLDRDHSAWRALTILGKHERVQVPTFNTGGWFDHWLKGIDTGMMAEPPIKLFVMGANVWRDEEDWPLARAVDTPYYLRDGGRLSLELPDTEAPDTYDYDPADPVPNLGGGGGNTPEYPPRSLRPTLDRGAPRRASISHPALGARYRSDRSARGAALGHLVGAGHRLHGAARRYLSGRAVDQPERGDRTRPLPQLSERGAALPDPTRPTLRIYHRPVGDEQRVQSGPPDRAAGDVELLPVLGPQSQHRPRLRRRRGAAGSPPGDPPRLRTPVPRPLVAHSAVMDGKSTAWGSHDRSPKARANRNDTEPAGRRVRQHVAVAQPYFSVSW